MAWGRVDASSSLVIVTSTSFVASGFEPNSNDGYFYFLFGLSAKLFGNAS